MNKILRLITTSLFIVLLSTGCSSKKSEKPKVADKAPELLYADAKALLSVGSFDKASEILEAIDSRYPFGPQSDQVQLDLIYAYYKRTATPLALANIDRFIRLNPTHKNLDYIYYMRGLTYMESDAQFFQDLFGIDRFNRDPTSSYKAFKDFNHLIRSFPDSEYAADALLRLSYLKNRLARYEISIAKWYIEREAFIAAINRSKIVLNNYSDTDSIEAALEIIIQGYDALKLEQPKQNALAVLKLNFPNNDLLRSTD